MIPGLTGTPLFKRGYKREQHKAPINECLAAAMVLMSGWNDDQTLLDPMCGSATIAIEAALKALNKPAGLLRPNYGIKHILGFDVGEWNSLRTDLKYQGNKDFEGRVRVITIMTGVSSPYILGKQRIQDFAAEGVSQEFNELGIDYVNN